MNNSLYKTFPHELSDPSTAWTYLRRRFPEYFEGVGKRPGECDKPVVVSCNFQVEQDVITVARHLLAGVKLADIAEALSGRREYGGAIYTRVKAVKAALQNTTTAPEMAIQADFGAEVVA